MWLPGVVSFLSVFAYNIAVPDLLLQTKLFKPTPRPSLISRPHLIDRLNDVMRNSQPVVHTRWPVATWGRL
jgi:hypothetical protein